jgi:hypothetical protein
MWRSSGRSYELQCGIYYIECKWTDELVTPSVYKYELKESGTPVNRDYGSADPERLPGELVSTATYEKDAQFEFVGQIRSSLGSGSGFVVKPNVVATAAHVVFNAETLSSAPGLQWLFQRGVFETSGDSGNPIDAGYEPVPQVPSGFFYFDDYAPSEDSTKPTFNRDVAALYFINENAGRGGYGGFLASDNPDANEHLLGSTNKVALGYPMEGIKSPDRNRLHQSTTSLDFQHDYGFLYTTASYRGSKGMSGGPVCVWKATDTNPEGVFIPAAIHLGKLPVVPDGSVNESVVRAIDSEVVELFTRAEIASITGQNENDDDSDASFFDDFSGFAATLPELSGLVVSASSEVSLGFSGGTTKYEVTVPNLTDSLTVTPTAKSNGTKIEVNLESVESGKSMRIPFGVNKSTTQITITLSLQKVTNTYTIFVNRAKSKVSILSSLALSSGTLSPVFSSGIKTYKAKVGNKVTSIKVTPKVKQADAKVRVNGVVVVSGTASSSIPLAEGADTIITLTVTAQDGKTKSIYKVTVTRAAASLASAFPLALSSPVREAGVVSKTTFEGLTYQQLTVEKQPGSGVRRIVEVSPNLLDWYSGNKFTTTLIDDPRILRVRDNTPITPGTKRYIRLKGGDCGP